MAMVVAKMSGHLQTQLTRSLERLLEEAYLSGELKLTGRKLKDFPNVGENYNLSDTVFADDVEPVVVYVYSFLLKMGMYVPETCRGT